MSVARFIADQRTKYQVPHTVVCALLGVSLAWFYKWIGRAWGPGAVNGLHTTRDRRRDTIDRAVALAFTKVKGRHGSPRLVHDLREDGWRVSERLSYSVGFGLPVHTPQLLAKIPETVWTPAYDAHDQVRDGAWVAELTGLLNLEGWPKGMRVIARKERPHPGAQLRLTDIDGLRITANAVQHRPRSAPRPGTTPPPPRPR